MGAVLDVSLVLLGFASLIARADMCRRHTGSSEPVHWLAVYGGGLAVAAFLVPGAWPHGLMVATVALIVALVPRRALAFLHPAGYLSLATTVQFRAAALAWLIHLTFTADLPVLTRILLAAIVAVTVLLMPVLALDTFLLLEAAGRTVWPNENPATVGSSHHPFVSVHVPCYAEPPDVVNATLDALARQDYGAFEVVVIDNNTKDERLWRPVEAHCRRLGPRFKFLHVDPLAGAKAGALNVALAHSDGEADLIAVVDADYQAEPRFLADLAGAFADPRLGFIQTSHDYRDWAHSPYQTGCYWEYRAMYGGYMRTRSQRASALTTGTMCLVRRRALEEVGGWAEWCCTEDSELSVRIHAAGYVGRYVHHTYGRGLVPEQFRGYKRQRYRWIYGPTQEFGRHWRLFLPARWATPSALTPIQKLLFAHHGSRELFVGAAGLIVTAAVVGLAISMALGVAGPPVTAAAVIGLAAGAAAGLTGLWPLFRRVLGCPRAQAWRAILCRLALFDTRLKAGTAGWRTRSGEFLRTNKFPASPNWTRAFAMTARETSRGVAALLLTGWVLGVTQGDGLALPLVGYLAVRAVGWLAAPVLALSAERSLDRVPVPAPPDPSRRPDVVPAP